MEAMASPSTTPAIPGERLLRPDDPGYDEARQVWNGMIDRRPAVIARVESTDEVVAALALSRARRPAGLDPRRRPQRRRPRRRRRRPRDRPLGDASVAVDPDAAARPRRRRRPWGDLDAAAQAHGLATPGGVVSRHRRRRAHAGGGLGWLRRKHGLSCDAFAAATVVTADGRVVRASADEHPDLFWGLRGGGGNFGVVTEFEFALLPARPDVATTVAIWPIGEAAAGPARLPRAGADAARRGLAGRRAVARPRRRGLPRVDPRRRRPVHPGAWPRRPSTREPSSCGRSRPSARGGRRHRRPHAVRRVPAVLRRRLPGPHDALLLEVVVRGRALRRPRRRPRRGVRAPAVAPLDHRHLGQPRRGRARVERRDRVRPASRGVADQPGVELGVGGGRRREPRLGPRHRRRHRRAAPT